jgi:23S rRNA pseudouridine955/2504/2580 synthase
MISIDITEQEAPQRLDRFLMKYLNQAKKSVIFRLIRKKIIRVNGKRVKENHMLQPGDTMAIYLADESFAELREEPQKLTARESKLDIVYEDDDILIVNKPVGMLTHPDKNEYKKTLATLVLYYLADLCGKTFNPAPIQRLDKNTSGLILFAKTYESLKLYNELMRERKLGKYYITIVKGNMTEGGEVKGFLTKDEVENKVTITLEGPGLAIHTKYQPLEVKRGYTKVEVELLTGRSHQIRASMNCAGFPIVGDTKYGGKKMVEHGQFLHAWKLILADERVFTCESEKISTFWDNL